MTRSPGINVWARASLRSRVLFLAVVLLSTGFSAFALVTGNALRGYLEDRVDSQLQAAAQVFSALPPQLATNGAQLKRPIDLADFSTDVLGSPVITYVSADGTVEKSIYSLGGANRAKSARGPALPRVDAAAVAARGERPFTVGSAHDETRWRMVVVPRLDRSLTASTTGLVPAASGSVVVSTSMARVDSTLDRMWGIYRNTGLGLLAVLALAGWFAVRSGLRPLSRVEQTAAEIARGDLSRRIPELAGSKTEVGRLATALNGMLGQLESAFAARADSEARMSRFVADASHELRTPLAGIKGLTGLYRMGALADRHDVDAAMDRIARESDRLAQLVEDMLQLARLDEHDLKAAGRSLDDEHHGVLLGLDLAPGDLRTLAADALHDVRALDPTRPVALTGPADEDLPTYAPALVDEARLRQVVANLVGNAVTHTPPGTPVRIGVGRVGDHAVLEVADQGPGLSPEQSTRIFERFYRADTSRNRATGGAGLGLSIVQSLVRAHAGHVVVLSSPGKGATFQVFIPALVSQ
ncbi:sensor histidine kinase [Streptomyces sp. NPDC090106]|uniref:sensor histidine kinase n=1 Tax=Streptomyces sp. NPDC090106 TaxID=3365946 RepID=UPI00382B8CC6